MMIWVRFLDDEGNTLAFAESALAPNRHYESLDVPTGAVHVEVGTLSHTVRQPGEEAKT